MNEAAKTVTKAEIAERLCALGVSQSQALKIVDGFYQELIQALQRGEVIHLKGFGAFHYKVRGARQGRNPKTHEKVAVPSKKVIHFRPAGRLKQSVKNAEPASEAGS